jgi:hypothetical protein
MANQRHLAIFKQGAEAWNEWRAKHRRVRPNLSGAEIVLVDARNTDFRAAASEE